MIRRVNGVKYLDIDGANSVVHMCSSAENYFDRFAFDDQPSLDLIADFIDDSKGLGIFLPGKDTQECCYCGYANDIRPLIPNNSTSLTCRSCKKEMSIYVIQISSQLETILGLQGPASGMGITTIWLSVPSKHPEFIKLLGRTGYSHGSKIKCYDGNGGAPWWPYYHLFLSSMNKKAD